MAGTIGSALRAFSVLRGGDFKEYGRRVRRGFHSDTESYGLRRDLSKTHVPPEPRIPITIRPLIEDDIEAILKPPFEASGEDPPPDAMMERELRRQAFEAGMETCFVAVTEDGRPCYMQWLMTSAQNSLIRDFFGGLFPELRSDEVLLENAFMLETCRGQRIMPWAMYHIAQQGAALGARSAITFVGSDNVPSLIGCRRAGFAPYMLRTQRWRLFRRTVDFTPLPEGSLLPFEE